MKERKWIISCREKDIDERVKASPEIFTDKMRAEHERSRLAVVEFMKTNPTRYLFKVEEWESKSNR